tara:strand:- start:83 stop:271 length:189 start_codon:yes stop_codon:yes gene_type:complete
MYARRGGVRDAPGSSGIAMVGFIAIVKIRTAEQKSVTSLTVRIGILMFRAIPGFSRWPFYVT